MLTEATENWREATPDASDDEGSSSDRSTTYESGELTPRSLKRPRNEEEDDLDYDPRGDVEREGPHVEPEENPTHDPNEDGKEQWLEV